MARCLGNNISYLEFSYYGTAPIRETFLKGFTVFSHGDLIMGIRDTKKVNSTKIRSGTKGAKTFKTEELAHLWAKQKNMTGYKLVDVRHLGATDKKIKVVAK